jgi:hypothetical protein
MNKILAENPFFNIISLICAKGGSEAPPLALARNVLKRILRENFFKSFPLIFFP